MYSRTRKVRLALALTLVLAMSYVMAKPGMASSAVVVSAVNSQTVVAVTLKRPQPSLQESTLSGAMSIKYDPTSGDKGLSPANVPNNFSATPGTEAKPYALLLSSFGILGAIAMLRLTGAFSIRASP